jgi:predicted  nucleic acid-binding Zn-ribbon protein
MLRRRKKKLTAEVAALREEVHELRQAVEGLRPATPPTPLPGEGEVVEMIVEDATQIADERDDLARQLADAKRKLAEIEKGKPAAD